MRDGSAAACVAVSLNRSNTSPKLSAVVATQYRFSVPFCRFVIGGFKFDSAHHGATLIQNVQTVMRHCLPPGIRAARRLPLLS